MFSRLLAHSFIWTFFFSLCHDQFWLHTSLWEPSPKGAPKVQFGDFNRPGCLHVRIHSSSLRFATEMSKTLPAAQQAAAVLQRFWHWRPVELDLVLSFSEATFRVLLLFAAQTLRTSCLVAAASLPSSLNFGGLWRYAVTSFVVNVHWFWFC